MINAEQHFALKGQQESPKEEGKRPARRSSSPVKIAQHRSATWWAQHLGVCLRTIQRRIKSGDISPVIPLGGRRVLIPESSIAGFLERLSQVRGHHEAKTN